MRTMLTPMAIKTFFIFFLCLWIPVCGIVAYWQTSALNDERAAYERDADEKTARFSENLKSEFSRVTLAGYSLFRSQWYRHMANSSNIYAGEFNAIRQLEISAWIADKVNSFDYVSDILIVSPIIDTVVCKYNWYTLDGYRSTIHMAALNARKGENAFATATDASGKVFPIVIHDTEVRLLKSTACILIDRSAFAAHCQRLLNDGMDAVSVELLGETLFEAPGALEDHTWREAEYIAFPRLRVRVGFPRFEDTRLRAGLTVMALSMGLLTLLSVFIAAGLCVVTLKPLNRVLSRLQATDHRSTQAAYAYIDHYLDTIDRDNRALKSENTRLSQSTRRFCEVMRDEILFSMVATPNFDFQNEYLHRLLPWIDDELYYLLFACDFGENEEAVEGALRDLPCLHREHFHILGSERCDIFWFEDAAQANACLQALGTRMENGLREACPCDYSLIQRDLQDMRDCYMALRGGFRKQFESSRELPISLQTELIQRVREGRMEECASLIDSAREAYDPESLLRLALLIAREYDVDAGDALAMYKKCLAEKRPEALWDVLSGFLRDVCGEIARSKRRGMDDLAQAVREIVDADFEDDELSRKRIADQLGVDGSLISKVFKARYDVGFSDYLIEKRMEKACALLTATDESLAAVAEKVGYLNYLSFKRAFARVKGVSPRQYRELRK